MIEKVLDGLKGIAKLIGGLIWLLVVLPWMLSQWLLELQMSADIKAKQRLLEEIKPKPVKKRAPRKKKVVETIANETINA